MLCFVRVSHTSFSCVCHGLKRRVIPQKWTCFCDSREHLRSEIIGSIIYEQLVTIATLHSSWCCQVGAALRPAFTPETAPDVTAAACEVCHQLLHAALSALISSMF